MEVSFNIFPVYNSEYGLTRIAGGDVRIGECLWAFGSNGRGLAPTVPYSHAGVRVFGHYLGEIMSEAHKVIEGNHCDDRCRFILDRVISTDLHHETPERYKQLTQEFSHKYAHAKRILHGKKHNSEMKVFTILSQS